MWKFLRKLKIELPYDPAIPLLGTYLDKTLIQRETRAPVFTAALFTEPESLCRTPETSTLYINDFSKIF